ncbi:putative methanogenesis regulatory protein FilR2 [ANME-1 cluster archaeon GoMg1]|nr:putative methanogenesis regulatory protein FilR2 [ANME-1 cluster archaeon GoMg1]VUT25263.1 MAG: response regulator of RpoS [Candidatus Methanolliviera sp. GoM_asphalt]
MKGKVVILLVEDEEAHAMLIMRVLEDAQVAKVIHWVADGGEALDYLFRRGEYVDEGKSPRPDLILLDLRLPKIDGLEVLKEIKQSEELRGIPVVILTTSESETDMARAYHQYVNSYLVKPVDFTKFNEMISDLGFYWLVWNRQPGRMKE